MRLLGLCLRQHFLFRQFDVSRENDINHQSWSRSALIKTCLSVSSYRCVRIRIRIIKITWDDESIVSTIETMFLYPNCWKLYQNKCENNKHDIENGSYYNKDRPEVWQRLTISNEWGTLCISWSAAYRLFQNNTDKNTEKISHDRTNIFLLIAFWWIPLYLYRVFSLQRLTQVQVKVFCLFKPSTNSDEITAKVFAF